MKQKIVWCIGFVDCFSLLHQWEKKKDDVFNKNETWEYCKSTVKKFKKKKSKSKNMCQGQVLRGL